MASSEVIDQFIANYGGNARHDLSVAIAKLPTQSTGDEKKFQMWFTQNPSL